MKKVLAFLLVMLLTIGVASAETIHLVAPMTGYTQERIDASLAKEEKDRGAEEKWHILINEGMAEDYPDYEMEYVDWGWAESLDQKQRSLIAAGMAPDILAGETFMPTYASEGLLEPLPQDIVDLVNPTFILYDPAGTPVGVGVKSSIFLLFYNKDLMAAAGLDPETPPTTWEEWKEMSDAITAAGNGEFYGGGIPSFPHAGGSLRATPFFRQCGTDFAVDGLDNLSDPDLQETLAFIREMNRNFPAGMGNSNEEDPLWDAFNAGKIAFAVDGSWRGSAATANGLNWGVAQLPTRDGKAGNCLVGTIYLSVSSSTPYKEAAFDVLRECLAEKNELIWLTESVCPPLNSIIDDESYYADDPVLMMEMEALKNGTYSGLAVFSKNDSAVWEIINQQVLARVTMTEDDIATICSDAQAQIAMLLQ